MVEHHTGRALHGVHRGGEERFYYCGGYMLTTKVKLENAEYRNFKQVLSHSQISKVCKILRVIWGPLILLIKCRV